MTPLTFSTLANRADLESSLARIRNDGCAWVEGEFDPHVTGLSVSIYDEKNQVAAAISTNFLRSKYNQTRDIEGLLPALRSASTQLAGLVPDFLCAH